MITNKKTRLAFYLGRRKDNKKALLGDWLICFVTKSPYSHVELLASHNKAPANTFIKGERYYGPMATMYSSSIRDKGVRSKWATLVPERWVVVEFDGDSKPALGYIQSKIGTPYGWPDLIGFLLPISFNTVWEFCSEIVSRGLSVAGFSGLKKANKTHPGYLFDWAMQQPNARIVFKEELHLYWAA